MTDFLDVLAHDAKETVDSGYYKDLKAKSENKVSLRKKIQNSRLNAIITEIKGASPSLGTIRRDINPKDIARDMQKGGAIGISVLTEPKHFNGSLQTLSIARKAVDLPILMKDIFVSSSQINCAAGLGANAVLLIQAIYDRGYGELSIDEMVALAHSKGLEVILETHTEKEFITAIESKADLVGINNRDLSTLKIDLNTTKEILQKVNSKGKLVVSESGIKSPFDIRFLRGCGASAFLVGSSVMLTDNIELKIKEFVNA